jgi:hypothetical protein
MDSAAVSKDDWISPARFRLSTTGVDGVEVDYGVFWGARHDQRVTLRLHRHDPDGVLYAYDPLWDEYRILADNLTRRDVDAAVGEVTAVLGSRGVPVGVLAATLQQRISRTADQQALPEPARPMAVQL